MKGLELAATLVVLGAAGKESALLVPAPLEVVGAEGTSDIAALVGAVGALAGLVDADEAAALDLDALVVKLRSEN
jgi:hypothetical protein